MIHIRKIFRIWTLMTVALLLFCGQAAALTLTAGEVSGDIGATVSVPVTISNATGVGGVAFTMIYDPAVFKFQNLSQGAKVIDDGSGDINDYTPDQYRNNLFYQANDEGAPTAPVGRLMVAAATADGLSGTNMVLLNANFEILGGNGEYPIGLVPTIINNAAAGYSVPTYIPVFVGTSTKNQATQMYDALDFLVFTGTILTDGSITVNASKFNITGTVNYASTPAETPAAGATVVLKRSTASGWVFDAGTTVSATGSYTFASKVPGNYQVFVTSNSPDYYNSQSAAFSVTNADVTVPLITLPAPQRLTGSVTLNGGYLPGLQVKVMSGATVIGVYAVNENGSFQTPPLPPGTYTLYAVYGGLTSENQLTGSPLSLAWETTLRSIGGTINGLTGSAAVTAGSANGNFQKMISVTGDGAYTITNLVPANDYIVSVTGTGLPVTYYDGETDISEATAVNISTANKTDANFDFTASTQGTISGRITENSADASIGVYAFETTTYALNQVDTVSGDYTFTLAPGNYEIFVIKANGKIFYYRVGGATQSRSAATILTLAADEALTGKDINITECDNVLTGKVTYKLADGDPAANVLITASSTAGNGIAITGPDGSYSIGGLCAASYLVEMNPLDDKYAVQSTTVTFPASGGSAVQDFVIDTGNVLSGEITDAADGTTPVQNAMVYLADQQTGGLMNGRMYFSNNEGNYTIADIPYGIYTLNVTHSLYNIYSYPDLEIRTDTTKDVQLTKGDYFNVTVTDGSNGDVALPGALVIVTRSGAVPVYAMTGANGNCKIYGLDDANSDYLILVQKAGYERQVLLSQTPSAGGTVVNVSLTKPAVFSLSGTVRSDCTDNPPVAGAYVVVSTATKKFFASAITAEETGAYSFTDLPQASDYRLVVIPGGALRTLVQTGLNYTGAATFTNDISIPCGSNISGTITAGAAPIYVFLYTSAGEFVGYTQAGAGGTYSFAGLVAGTYKVLAVSSGFTPEWYNGKETISTADGVNPGGTANINLTD